MIRNTALLTGSTGFIGANLARHLIKNSYKVHILTRPESSNWRIKDILPHLVDHRVNFQNKKELQGVMAEIKPNIIFHLASYGGYPFQQNLQNMVEANIVETVNLLESLKTIDYQVFINAGSSSEYGYKTEPMKESDALSPNSFYAATKASATYISQVYSRMYQKPIVTVRPFSVYGPYEEPTKFIPPLITRSLKGEDIHLTQGIEKRDFIYIDDFIDGLLAICHSPDKVKGKVINLGSGKQYSVKEAADLIASLTGSKSKLHFGTYKPRNWDTNYWVADISLAKRLLGWQPANSFEEGLKKTIAWFEKNINLYEKKN